MVCDDFCAGPGAGKRRRIMAGREPDTVEAGALVERVPGQREVQMSQEGGVSQFCSELGS